MGVISYLSADSENSKLISSKNFQLNDVLLFECYK